MNLLPQLTFIATVLLLLSESAFLPDDPQGLVILGSNAVLGQFPYVAALYYQNFFLCTCTIISATTILTAAHCIVLKGIPQPANLYHAIANVDKTASAHRIEFSSVTVHPGYVDGYFHDDLAIFKTDSNIPFDGKIPIKPICLAKTHDAETTDETCVVMGWGRMNRDFRAPPEVPNILQYTEVKIVDNLVCALFNSGIHGDKLCANGNFSGPCKGDSGGPLVHLDGKQPVALGITSYVNANYGCGSVAPVVFTRISRYIKYIMDVSQDDGICTV